MSPLSLKLNTRNEWQEFCGTCFFNLSSGKQKPCLHAMKCWLRTRSAIRLSCVILPEPRNWMYDNSLSLHYTFTKSKKKTSSKPSFWEVQHCVGYWFEIITWSPTARQPSLKTQLIGLQGTRNSARLTHQQCSWWLLPWRNCRCNAEDVWFTNSPCVTL